MDCIYIDANRILLDIATIGVIFRDSAQITTSLVNIMMFLSPVFYPSSAIPENIRWLTNANPMRYMIMETRNILLSNCVPDIWLLSKFIMASIVSVKLAFG